jgi:hypothetical protein
MYSVSPIISMVPYHLQRLKKENPDRFLVGVGVPSIEKFAGGWGWGEGRWGNPAFDILPPHDLEEKQGVSGRKKKNQ